MLTVTDAPPKPVSSHRIESIDLLRGAVLIIMTLDHLHDYFHDSTLRCVTYYCASVFIFLAGISARLYEMKRGRKELSLFLLTRGCWLVILELCFHLEMIRVIGICMIVLSVLIYLNRRVLLLVGVLLISVHNLPDGVHIPGKEAGAFLQWIGIMAIGYFFGTWYAKDCDSNRRRLLLFLLGYGSLAVFFFLRTGNWYGDAAWWLMTLGLALIFLAFAEGPLNRWKAKVAVFGRVAMFYYLLHILLIHLLALLAAVISGYKWPGYGSGLGIVYIAWIGLLLLLYPCCKWFDRYKRSHLSTQWWLSYL